MNSSWTLISRSYEENSVSKCPIMGYLSKGYLVNILKPELDILGLFGPDFVATQLNLETSTRALGRVLFSC